MSVLPAGPPEAPRNFRERSEESVWGYTFRKAPSPRDITHYALRAVSACGGRSDFTRHPVGDPPRLSLILATPQGTPARAEKRTRR